MTTSSSSSSFSEIVYVLGAPNNTAIQGLQFYIKVGEAFNSNSSSSSSRSTSSSSNSSNSSSSSSSSNSSSSSSSSKSSNSSSSSHSAGIIASTSSSSSSSNSISELFPEVSYFGKTLNGTYVIVYNNSLYYKKTNQNVLKYCDYAQKAEVFKDNIVLLYKTTELSENFDLIILNENFSDHRKVFVKDKAFDVDNVNNYLKYTNRRIQDFYITNNELFVLFESALYIPSSSSSSSTSSVSSSSRSSLSTSSSSSRSTSSSSNSSSSSSSSNSSSSSSSSKSSNSSSSSSSSNSSQSIGGNELVLGAPNNIEVMANSNNFVGVGYGYL